MVNYNVTTIDRTFHALGDPTRLAIVKQLAQNGVQTVRQLASPHDVSAPAISKHLKVLEAAELIIRKKEGRTHYITLNPEPIDSIGDWFRFYQSFWQKRLDRLEEILQQEENKKEK